MTLAVRAARTWGGKTERDRMREADEVLDAHNAGATVADIMARFGISKPTVYRRIDLAISNRIAPTVDEYRSKQDAYLDYLVRRWHQHAAAATAMIEAGTRDEVMSLVDRGMTKHAEALNGLLRVAERRAKLNGLDAPVKVEATVTHHNAADLELEAMMNALDTTTTTAKEHTT